jgi:hypothetical protein
MVQYALPQNPEITITVPGKDSEKNREKAMEQLIQMIEDEEIPASCADGFGPQQFVELKDPGTLVVGSEDALSQAVQLLSGLATLKLKAQESREEALKIREQVDVLFTDEPVSEDEITQLKDGFKILKTYAQANLRYRAARAQAETARAVIDEALKSPEPEVHEEGTEGEPTGTSKSKASKKR